MSNKLFICGKKKNLKCIVKGTENNIVSEIDLASKNLDKEPLKFVISGIYHNFIVTRNDKIYTFGGNHFGQLGLGNTDDQHELTELNHPALANQKIEEISGRACFVGISTDKNEVFLFGLNNFGQLGAGHTKNLNEPNKIKIESLEKHGYAKLCCAGVHTIIVTSNNEIWVCGYNTYGQLGISSKDDSYKPVELTSFKKEGIIIKDVICGDYHSIFLSENGKLWSCGKNSQGQLGLEDTAPRTVPHPITFFDDMNITHVSCGENHSIVVVDNREVYGFGTNARGQLGLDDTKSNIKRPTKIELPTNESIKILQCGRNFTVLVTTNDQIIVFGDNNSGQLGFDTADNQYIKNPSILHLKGKEDKEISAVSCGEYHSMFLCSNIPSPKTPSAMMICMKQMLLHDESQNHLFDSKVECSDDRIVHVFKDMINIRYPNFSAIVINDFNGTINVKVSYALFMVILSYIYTGDISSGELSLDALMELYCCSDTYELPEDMVSQLLLELVSQATEETVSSMILKMQKYTLPNPHSNPLRLHLLMYIKQTITNDQMDLLKDSQMIVQNSNIMMELFSIKLDKEKLLNKDALAHSLGNIEIEKDFERLYDEMTGDVTIWLDEDHQEFVKVHKSLLAFRAPNYMGMFQAGMQDSHLNEIDVSLDFQELHEGNLDEKELYISNMKDLLKYIYTSNLTISINNARYLFDLWDLLGMSIKDKFYGTLLSKIMSNINEENVISILGSLVGGRTEHFPDLERLCIDAGAKLWSQIHEKYTDDQLLSKISFQQYMKINRAYLKKRSHLMVTHQSDPASANK
mmetsp:Transcript_216/g.378  ORF Transcript_216/g.378 Transcript_216/m.378 type:complete len:805 (+) Transcript_216:165-2579(+)